MFSTKACTSNVNLSNSSWPDGGGRYEFYLVQGDLIPTRKLSVTPIMIMPLFHQRAYPSRPIVIIAHRVHHCGQPVMAFFSNSEQSNCSTMKASQWEWNFQFNTSLISASSMA